MLELSGSLNLDAVALFPLPNVVLLPRAVLPLHIFEFRYRQMTADVLAGDKLFAMALLMPGWEKDYHNRPAVEPVVCVGIIRSHEQLPDGTFNLLLQGVLRATIDREFADRPYRYASLKHLKQTDALEIDLLRERARLRELFAARPLVDLPVSAEFGQLLAGPLPTSDIADLVAFHFIEQTSVKQEILADGDIIRRTRRVVDALEEHLPLTALLKNDDRTLWN